MNKTSSSHLQNQTDPSQVEVHDEETSLSIMQSPPLIIDGQIDQKVENGGLKPKIDEKGNTENLEKNNSMCIVDVRNEEETKSVTSNDNDEDDEKVCRICQLRSSDHLPAGTGNINLVLLGCACRGELSLSHYHCALVWFQRKGNRTCEICGQPAKNIAGIEDTGFRAYGTDLDIITSAEIAMNSGSYESETDQRCSKCLSKIILAVLVLAFLLPWAIHPNKLL
ncbi:putative E3 ubiquitin ligase SUD1 [Bienertia sinuspersici]